MTDSALTESVFAPDIWTKLSPEVQADIFLTRRNKAVRDLYHFSRPEKIGEIITERLSGKPASKNCDSAAYYIGTYCTLIPKELTVKKYDRLKAAKTGANAVSALESAPAFMAFLNEKSEAAKHLPAE